MKSIFIALAFALPGSLAFANTASASLDCAMADSVLSLHADLNAETLSGPFTYHGIRFKSAPVTGVASLQNSPDQPVLHFLLQTPDGNTFATLDLDTTSNDDNGSLKFPTSSFALHIGCELK